MNINLLKSDSKALSNLGQRATNGNWMAGEPNGGGCVFTRRVSPSRSSADDGKWLEETCAARKGFVCESSEITQNYMR